MAWNCIRNAQDGEQETLNLKAIKFAEKHKIKGGVESDGELTSFLSDIEEGLMEKSIKKHLLNLWNKTVERTLKCPGATGIAYGKVGYHDS